VPRAPVYLMACPI